uniref:Uncharacterized protein n=1 Tax=Arundo donax TaxID=35708 RepID=A0A0A9EVE4_ARUDO
MKVTRTRATDFVSSAPGNVILDARHQVDAHPVTSD